MTIYKEKLLIRVVGTKACLCCVDLFYCQFFVLYKDAVILMGSEKLLRL